jgi:hypothetical protein
VAGCCECGDEPSGSCATELVRGDGLLTLGEKVASLSTIFSFYNYTAIFVLKFPHFPSVLIILSTASSQTLET